MNLEHSLRLSWHGFLLTELACHAFGLALLVCFRSFIVINLISTCFPILWFILIVAWLLAGWRTCYIPHLAEFEICCRRLAMI